jgi:hypothetical protein
VLFAAPVAAAAAIRQHYVPARAEEGKPAGMPGRRMWRSRPGEVASSARWKAPPPPPVRPPVLSLREMTVSDCGSIGRGEITPG